METTLLLTNKGVIIKVKGDEDKLISDSEFYSKRSNMFKHVDMKSISRMFSSERFVITNNKDKLVTLEAMRDGKSKLTQVNPDETLKFNRDSYMS